MGQYKYFPWAIIFTVKDSRMVVYFSSEKSKVQRLLEQKLLFFDYVPSFFKTELPVNFFEIQDAKFMRELSRKIKRFEWILLCGSGGEYIYEKFRDVFAGKNVLLSPISRRRKPNGETVDYINKPTGRRYSGEYVLIQGERLQKDEDLIVLDDAIASGSTIKVLEEFFPVADAWSILTFSEGYDGYIRVKEKNGFTYLLFDLLKEKEANILSLSTLVPVFVQSADGTPLMLAYADEEALGRTLNTGYAWFYSRSRKKYWLKGETSGNKLAVKDVLIDCDLDALVYIVEPTGPVCHTGERSCFFRRVVYG